jgi:hypothetical protein
VTTTIGFHGSHEQHAPSALLRLVQRAEEATPLDFDRATLAIDPRDVLAVVRASADVNRHLAWLAEDVEMGFAQIYLHNVNPDHDRFFGELAPHALALGKDQGTSP